MTKARGGVEWAPHEGGAEAGVIVGWLCVGGVAGVGEALYGS